MPDIQNINPHLIGAQNIGAHQQNIMAPLQNFINAQLQDFMNAHQQLIPYLPLILPIILMVAVFEVFQPFQPAYNDAGRQWQMDFQDPATPIMEGIISLHHYIFFFIIIIVTFVLYMLLRIIILFRMVENEKRSLGITDNKALEIVWTISPAMVLVLIGTPSFVLLYSMDDNISPTVTLKAIGHQWFWSYEYSDHATPTNESIQFDSYMVAEEDLALGDLRLLEVDNHIVLPTNTHICVVVTAADVIHSWSVPSLGVKIDAVPGRLNQINLFLKREGVYYGQCSEICGPYHGFMPIVVEAVSPAKYLQYIKTH